MRNIYVPIRAYGDFTITSAVIKNHFAGKVPVILPRYMKTLYEALAADDYYDIVDEIGLKISAIFFELHKIKGFVDVIRLVKETLLINRHLSRKDNYLFDYDSSRLNIFFKQFSHPDKNANMYQAKIDLFAKYYAKKTATDLPDFINSSAIKKAVFFPGSRKKIKMIDQHLIDAILNSGIFNSIELCYHNSENPPEGAIVFEDAEQLKNIMISHDFILSADSLPVHMAYYFNIPHFCIYNDLLNKQWITPYMAENNSFLLYKGDISAAVNTLKNNLDR